MVPGKPKVQTLADLSKPKSKKMNAMPSLQNAKPAERKKKEVKAFAGQGVKLGSMTDSKKEIEAQQKVTTFSGITKKVAPIATFQWRCQSCLMLNKQENTACSKCNSGRERTEAEKEEYKK